MERITVTIEKLIWKGRSIARQANGQVVLVEPGVLPGERVQCVVQKEKKDFIAARPETILQPSMHRRPHPCPYAGSCGGCVFGILPRSRQLKEKRSILLDALHRNLPRESLQYLPELSVLYDKHAWRYRWRAQIHVISGQPHTMAASSREPVHIEDCLLLARPLASKLKPLCSDLPNGRHVLAAGPADLQVRTDQDRQPLVLDYPEFGFSLQAAPASFFQANWPANKHLIEHVLSLVPREGLVADLYAGNGNFALPLAVQGHHVIALENDPEAVAFAQKTARSLELSSMDFLRADMRKNTTWEMLRRKQPRTVIIDPPRSGSGPVCRQLANMENVSRIIWISCDVVNTCRDMGPLLKSGWHLTSMTYVDMFPQTWHMEVVFLLTRQ